MKDEKTSFSVLLPVYQGDDPQYLLQALNSIFRQTIQPTEIVVVVDGFIDKALNNVLHNYRSYLTIFYYSENCGLGEVLARGVDLCQCNIIARMDADDVCVSNRFEKQVIFLTNYPDIDIVGSYITEFNGSIDKSTGIRKVPINNKRIKEYAKKRNPFNHMTVMFRKEAVMQSGNYQQMALFEDYYLWIRMLQHNIKMANIDESLVYVRTGRRMYDRRGGIQYAKKEIEFYKELHALKFISKIQVIKNLIIRTGIRILPNRMRAIVYTLFLREKNMPLQTNKVGNIMGVETKEGQVVKQYEKELSISN